MSIDEIPLVASSAHRRDFRVRGTEFPTFNLHTMSVQSPPREPSFAWHAPCLFYFDFGIA
jgi:hypothetical protein